MEQAGHTQLQSSTPSQASDVFVHLGSRVVVALNGWPAWAQLPRPTASVNQVQRKPVLLKQKNKINQSLVLQLLFAKSPLPMDCDRSRVLTHSGTRLCQVLTADFVGAGEEEEPAMTLWSE